MKVITTTRLPYHVQLSYILFILHFQTAWCSGVSAGESIVVRLLEFYMFIQEYKRHVWRIVYTCIIWRACGIQYLHYFNEASLHRNSN